MGDDRLHINLKECQDSLVPRPSYFEGVENEGLVHAVRTCTNFNYNDVTFIYDEQH